MFTNIEYQTYPETTSECVWVFLSYISGGIFFLKRDNSL